MLGEAQDDTFSIPDPDDNSASVTWMPFGKQEVTPLFFVGYRKSDRAILRHFLVLFYVIDDEKRVVHYSIVERQTSAIIVGNPRIRE